MLLLETKDACSVAWWFSPNAPLVFLLWPLVCAFLLDFSVTSKATKKIPACCECSLAESGFFFVCRSEDNFKDNSPHCVLPSCSLFLSVFGFVLCFLCPFFSTLFFWVDFSALWSFPQCSFLPFFCSALPFIRPLRACPSNQSWLCKTVILPRTGLWAENVVTIGSVLLPIFQLPYWIGMKKIHDCSPTTVSFRQEWKYSLWPLISLISTIGILISNKWFLTVPLG